MFPNLAIKHIFAVFIFTFTRPANAPCTMSEAQTPTEIAEDTTPDPKTHEADDERKKAVRALKDLERKYPMLKEFREEEAVEYKVIQLQIPMISSKTFTWDGENPRQFAGTGYNDYIDKKSVDYHKKHCQKVLDDYADFYGNTLNKLGAKGWTLSHIQRPQPGEKNIITNVRGKWMPDNRISGGPDFGEWNTYKTELPHYYIFTRSRSKANKEDQLTEMLGKLLQKLDDK